MSIRTPMRTPFGPVRPGGFHFPHGSRSGVSVRFSRKPRRSDVSSFDTSPARQRSMKARTSGRRCPPFRAESRCGSSSQAYSHPFVHHVPPSSQSVEGRLFDEPHFESVFALRRVVDDRLHQRLRQFQQVGDLTGLLPRPCHLRINSLWIALGISTPSLACSISARTRGHPLPST